MRPAVIVVQSLVYLLWLCVRPNQMMIRQNVIREKGIIFGSIEALSTSMDTPLTFLIAPHDSNVPSPTSSFQSPQPSKPFHRAVLIWVSPVVYLGNDQLQIVVYYHRPGRSWSCLYVPGQMAVGRESDCSYFITQLTDPSLGSFCQFRHISQALPAVYLSVV
jgi:hypothetical protein